MTFSGWLETQSESVEYKVGVLRWENEEGMFKERFLVVLGVENKELIIKFWLLLRRDSRNCILWVLVT
jgi:hypothetical protein